MRLIEGEELKQIVIGVWNDIDRYVEGDISLSDIIGIIDDMPTIEPEIIRCKDCKHYRAYAGIIDGHCYMAEWYKRYQYENDFCSRAERREDG